MTLRRHADEHSPRSRREACIWPIYKGDAPSPEVRALLTGSHPRAGQHPARFGGRRGAAPFPRRHCGAAGPRVDRLPVDGRRLWRPQGRVGRRDEPDCARSPNAACAACRPSAPGSSSARDGPACRDLPAGGHLRSWPQRDRQPARRARRGASSSLAKYSTASTSTTSPACWPQPSTRTAATASTTSATTSRPPPQDVVAYAAELLGLPVPPAVPFEQAGLTRHGCQLLGGKQARQQRPHPQDLGVDLLYPTYREGLRALAAT